MADKENNTYTFGMSYGERNAFLELFELTTPEDKKLADILQREVIRPNIGAIVDEFYGFMLAHESFRAYLKDKVLVTRLKGSQDAYLQSLGVDFDSPGYFEDRLRVGMIHKQVGLPTTLYQSAYTKLLQIIVEKLPGNTRVPETMRRELESFARRITALDMALAIHTYHTEHIQEMQQFVNTLRTEGAQLRDQVSTDELTGVHTRNHIMVLLSEQMAYARKHNTELSLAMLDLDHFKKINDTYGHLAGDKVLREAGETIQNILRGDDRVGRYGGEEFMIILRNAGSDDAMTVLERLRTRLADKVIRLDEKQSIQVTISAGVASLSASDSMDSLIHRADEALYDAKRNGRNRIASR